MKRGVILLIILLLIPSVFPQEEDFNQYTDLTMEFEIKGKFTLVQGGSNPSVEDVNTYLTFIPQNDILQRIKSKEYNSNPEAEITETENEVNFKWESAELVDYDFSVSAEVNMKNAVVTVDEKVPFPIINSNSQNFIEPTEYIDITPEIRSLAQSLAEGEDDLYVVSVKMAQWVEENIEYDLSTLTADAVQKSSWVLDNKQGVCDELTNLFISMMRSLGVPARFVSGLAYTNIGYKWGPHGWAEVYFPGKGWVPFDVTYKQFGWIDPGHIKLKVSEDSGDSTIRYSWKAHNVRMEGKDLNIETELKNKGEKISPMHFEVRPLINNVGPGSYVPIEIKVTNEKDYYLPRSFTIRKAPELTEKNFKSVLLKPLETKSIFFITKIPDNIERNYIYKTIIEVEDQFHTNRSAEITYSANLEIMSLEEAQAIIGAREETEVPVFSRIIRIDCNAPGYAFSYEIIEVDCKLRNLGNTNMETTLCYGESNCRSIELGIAEEKDATYSLNLQPGVQNLKFTSKFDGSEASDLVTINILENPHLRITDIEYPETVNYKDDFNITLNLAVDAPVKEVKIRINERSVILVPELETSKSVIIMAKGKDFLKQKSVNVALLYKDANNREYEVTSGYLIDVVNLPWYVKLLMFLKLA